LEVLLNTDELTVTGETLGENLAQVKIEDVYRDIVKPLNEPLHTDGGIAILKGNLSPNGSIIKPKAVIDKELMKHRGKAVVFTSLEDMEKRVNDPELDVTKDSVLVLQGAGPVG